LADWLADWLVGRLVGWLSVGLAGWLAGLVSLHRTPPPDTSGTHQHKKVTSKNDLGENSVHFFSCADFLQKNGNCVFAKIRF